jgi:hypothetical protein
MSSAIRNDPSGKVNDVSTEYSSMTQLASVILRHSHSTEPQCRIRAWLRGRRPGVDANRGCHPFYAWPTIKSGVSDIDSIWSGSQPSPVRIA